MHTQGGPRHLGRFVAVVLLLASFGLALPTAALAGGTRTVKNASGKTIGHVHEQSSHRGDVYNNHGKHVGVIRWKSGQHDYVVTGYWWLLTGDSGSWIRVKAFIEKFGLGRSASWNFYSQGDTAFNGMVAKDHGRWVAWPLKTAGTGTAIGSVSGSCPGWAAAAAQCIL